MELSPKQMIFVQEYIRNGGNATQAATRAGYSEKTAYSQGSRLLKSVEVQKYLQQMDNNIQRDLRELFAESAVEAFKVMKEIMLKPDAMDKDRLNAAKDLLDRAGYKPVDKIAADVNYTIEQLLEEL